MVAFLYYDHKSKKESQGGSFLLLIQVRGGAEPLQVAGKYGMSVFSEQLAPPHRRRRSADFMSSCPLFDFANKDSFFFAGGIIPTRG